MRPIYTLVVLFCTSAALAATDEQTPMKKPNATTVSVTMNCYEEAEEAILKCDCTRCEPTDPGKPKPECDEECQRRCNCPQCKKCPPTSTVTVVETAIVPPDCPPGSGTNSKCSKVGLWPLGRMWSAVYQDHFYASVPQEIQFAASKSYVAQGGAGRIFLNQVPGTTPLYRCFYADPAVADHFYTIDKAEFDKAMANGCQILFTAAGGVVGNVYKRQVCGSIPLYRIYNEAIHDHMLTIDKAERDNLIKTGGYKDDGLAGYVMP